jgi:murein tripeptide amidase MpaA
VRNDVIDRCRPRLDWHAALLLPALLLYPGALAGQSASYSNFADLSRELRTLVDGSDLAAMRPIGRSREGREIWLIEIGDRSGGPIDARPALLIVGNLTADHVLGSALALETIRYLLGGADGEAADSLDALLQDHVVYVIPRLDPDGAESMFASQRFTRTSNARPFDDDNDGRTDEDPPEDLNGDGLVTVMRVADPSGEYVVHPDDARLMKRAEPSKGESGRFTLYWEGVDSDGDGFFNEDGPGGVDLDRNFQHAYPYWERDAGPHMVSEPETRALMDFVLTHGNIGAILTFGHSDNLVVAPDSRGNLAEAAVLDLPAFADASNAEIFERGVFAAAPRFSRGFFFGGGGGQSRLRGAQPGRDNDPDSGRRPVTTVSRDDLEYFKTVSEAYREFTDITEVGVNREAEGAFFQYGYFQFGVPSFSTQGWGLPKPEPVESTEEREPEAETPEPSEPPRGQAALRRPQGRAGAARGGGSNGDQQGLDVKLLTAMDTAGIEVFVDWTPLTHPELGEVEIGGFRPYAASNPPAEQLPELGRAHGAFAVRLLAMLPRVRIAHTEVTDHGGDVFTVSVEVENSGYFPTALQHGVTSRSVQPTMVQIQVAAEAILSGDDKTTFVRRLDGSGARERVSWLIRGRQGASVDIVVRSDKGGTDTATVTLR